jgi:predicted ATPase
LNVTKEQFSSAIENFGKKSGLFDKIEIKNFSKDLSSPFILNIYLNGLSLKITNVGYGVGQVLPLLTEILVSYKGTWFSIQQPEVHLHPRAQAALGEFLYNSATIDEKYFLIETHSDFLIDRFRLAIKNGRKHKLSQVLFFERKKNGNTVKSIEINENGQYSDQQPKAFRDFFINEEMNLLSL